jgi:hypothetical protein
MALSSEIASSLQNIEQLFGNASKNTLTLDITYTYTDSSGQHQLKFNPTLTITNDYPAVTVNTVSPVQIWNGVQAMTMFEAGEKSLEQLAIPLSGSALQAQNALIIHSTLLFEDLDASLVEIETEFSPEALAQYKITPISPQRQTFYLATGSLSTATTSNTSTTYGAMPTFLTNNQQDMNNIINSLTTLPSTSTSSNNSNTVSSTSTQNSAQLASLINSIIPPSQTQQDMNNIINSLTTLPSTSTSSNNSNTVSSSSTQTSNQNANFQNNSSTSIQASTTPSTSKASNKTIWIIGGIAAVGLLALVTFYKKSHK